MICVWRKAKKKTFFCIMSKSIFLFFSANMRYKSFIVMYDLHDVTCNWIDICDEFDENVKNNIINIIDLIVIVVHVICDDVTNVMKNVIEIDLAKNAINVWFIIIVENDIVNDFFDDDEIDVLWFWIDAKIDIIKISNLIFLIFLIWCFSICLWNWILLEYLIEQRLHTKIFICFLIIRVFSTCCCCSIAFWRVKYFTSLFIDFLILLNVWIFYDQNDENEDENEEIKLFIMIVIELVILCWTINVVNSKIDVEKKRNDR